MQSSATDPPLNYEGSHHRIDFQPSLQPDPAEPEELRNEDLLRYGYLPIVVGQP